MYYVGAKPMCSGRLGDQPHKMPGCRVIMTLMLMMTMTVMSTALVIN